MKHSSFKSRLRRRVTRSPLRPVVAPLFEGLVRGQLALVERWDALRDDVPSLPAGVTAIIKTFERPRLLARLVASLARCFPGLPVIVADDSRVPSSLPGVKTLVLPFDSGVSAGRQAALDAVETEFTWVLDDDFVVFGGTGVEGALAALARFSSLDLVGGRVIDLPHLTQRGDPHELVYPTEARPLLALGTRLGEVVVCDKVPNFFVGRTERLRKVGWDARLRRVEHGDFFTRARGVLTTGFLRTFACLHAQTPFERAYMNSRDATAADEALLHARYFAAGRGRDP